MSDNGITRVMSKHLPAGKTRKEFFAEWIASLFKEHSQTFWKTVDTHTGEIVSIAVFTLNKEVPSTEEPSKPEDEAPPEGFAKIMQELWRDWSEFSKEHCSGRPHASRHSNVSLRLWQRAET